MGIESKKAQKLGWNLLVQRQFFYIWDKDSAWFVLKEVGCHFYETTP
jgi:hypothetical protein